MKKAWTVIVRTDTGRLTRHSTWRRRQDAVDQADMVHGRVLVATEAEAREAQAPQR